MLLALGFCAGFLFPVPLLENLRTQDYDPGSALAILSTLHASLFAAALSMLLVCLAVRFGWSPRRLRGWNLENPWLNRIWKRLLEPGRLPSALVCVLALLSAGQLGWVATQFIRPTALDVLTRSNPLVNKLKSEGNAVRVSMDAHDPMLNLLLQNQFNTPLISCLEISAASRLPDTLDTFLQTLNDDPARLWFLTGVKNRVIPQTMFEELQSDPRFKTNSNIDHVDGYTLGDIPTQKLPTHALLQFRDYLAKATFVPRAEVLPAVAARLERLKDPDWNPRETVLLEEAASAPPAGNEAVPAEPNVTLAAYDSHRIELAVRAPSAGYILINDAYDPDWEVELNGRPAPLLRADYLLRAFAVPAGPSAVTLRYVAHYHVGGWNLRAEIVNGFCDAAMLAAWLAGGIALWRGRKIVPVDAAS